MVLASFHYPVSDVRGLFADSLGRVRDPQLSGALPVDASFIRSVGVPRRRLLGGGDQFLKERYFFPFDRCFDVIANSPNRGIPLRIDGGRVKNRYYQFDQVCGRFDVSVPLHFTGRDPTGTSEVENIFANLRVLDLMTRKTYFPGQNRVAQAGNQFADFYQSRTTRERLIRYQQPPKAVFGGTPLLFIECVAGELPIKGSLQKLDSGLDGLDLYHGYLTREVRAWILVRRAATRRGFIDSRLMRMYLSRLYMQQEVFRQLVRKLPRLSLAAPSTSPESVLSVDLYTRYLSESRRFIAALSRSALQTTGHDFGIAARYAFDTIAPEEVDAVLESHEAIVTRSNIFANLKDDVLTDVALGQQLQGQPVIQSRNIIFNVFGRLTARQTIDNPVSIARPAVDKIGIVDILQQMAQFFAVFGAQVERSRQDAVTAILVEMGQIARSQDLPGPALSERIRQLRLLMASSPQGREQLEEIFQRLERAVLT